MSISAKDVNKLRQMTGAGMMDCKTALVEANGDFDEAVTILRKKGQKVSEKRADRETTEGVVLTQTTADNKEGFMIALNCETDFVAKNDDFVNLAKSIMELVASNKPADLQALNALKMGDHSISEKLVEYIGKIGEKIEVSAYAYLKADQVVSYIHSNSKLGVLVALDGTEGSDVTELGKDIAMQIAAMNPVALDKDSVDPSVIEKEIEIGKEQARQEGKPEEMLEKIAQGKLNKFYKESTLLAQQFVKDNSKTIEQLVKENGKNLKISAFSRISIG